MFWDCCSKVDVTPEKLRAKASVIASSTSGVQPSVFQSECAHPERCVVGHPFVPPYIIPLVEVVPGEKTSAEVAQWTTDFYNAIGKKALLLQNTLTLTQFQKGAGS